MSIDKTTRTKVDTTIRLTGEQIILALVDAGHIDSFPKGAQCVFQVPSGGDYSGMEVPVDEDSKVIIRYVEDK